MTNMAVQTVQLERNRNEDCRWINSNNATPNCDNHNDVQQNFVRCRGKARRRRRQDISLEPGHPLGVNFIDVTFIDVAGQRQSIETSVIRHGSAEERLNNIHFRPKSLRS
jgi:hypothetical protein